MSISTAGSLHRIFCPGSLLVGSSFITARVFSHMHTGTSSFGSVLVASTISVGPGFFKALNFVIPDALGFFYVENSPGHNAVIVLSRKP